ncbi:MAG: hypothetical protein Q4E47_03380 [Candidatus Saccharibacteria bacterium]|nr:hypothetical protein [Candidatus Saccharibacteria bacterium]
MVEIIKTKPNEDGRVVVRLFGQDIDVTGKVKKGMATVTMYGTTYEIHALQPKAVKSTTKKVKVADTTPKFIETPPVRFLKRK